MAFKAFHSSNVQNNMENFNIDRMREYLNLPDGPINSLGGVFDPKRFFCLVGTNHRDYEAGHGLSRAAVGPMNEAWCSLRTPTSKGLRELSSAAPVLEPMGWSILRRAIRT